MTTVKKKFLVPENRSLVTPLLKRAVFQCVKFELSFLFILNCVCVPEKKKFLHVLLNTLLSVCLQYAVCYILLFSSSEITITEFMVRINSLVFLIFIKFAYIFVDLEGPQGSLENRTQDPSMVYFQCEVHDSSLVFG